MTLLVERLRHYRRRKQPGGMGSTGGEVHTRLPDPLALAVDYIAAETNTDKSAVTRIALEHFARGVLGELGIPPRNFGLEDA